MTKPMVFGEWKPCSFCTGTGYLAPLPGMFSNLLCGRCRGKGLVPDIRSAPAPPDTQGQSNG